MDFLNSARQMGSNGSILARLLCLEGSSHLSVAMKVQESLPPSVVTTCLARRSGGDQTPNLCRAMSAEVKWEGQ